MMCEFGPMCTLFCDSELEHFTITPKFVYFAPCCRQKCTFFLQCWIRLTRTSLDMDGTLDKIACCSIFI